MTPETYSPQHRPYCRHLFIFLIAFLTLFTTARASGPGNPTTLTSTLRDVFNAYKVYHIVSDQKESISLFLSEGSPKELHDLLDNSIKTCESLKGQTINNDTLKDRVNSYLANTIANYELLKTKGPKSKEFTAQIALYKKQTNKYTDYLVKTYALSRFVHLTEDKYWKTMDKTTYIRSAKFPTYTKLRKDSLKTALNLLESISRSTTDFQETVIYQIELADQYVKHPDIQPDATELAIKTYKSILDQKKYTLYLYESWLKWRAVSQQNKGLSKTSEIPNDEYDKTREEVAGVILDYIAKHENDEMAINQFLVIATHDIVLRFGQYPYGNQNTIEYHEIFGN